MSGLAVELARTLAEGVRARHVRGDVPSPELIALVRLLRSGAVTGGPAVALPPLPAEAGIAVSTERAAALLGVSPRTLRRLAAAGQGPPFAVIGGRRRYRVGAIEQWLTRQESR